jgi:hypothetical protein
MDDEQSSDVGPLDIVRKFQIRWQQPGVFGLDKFDDVIISPELDSVILRREHGLP